MTVDQIMSMGIRPDGPHAACAACGHSVPGQSGANLAGVRGTVEGVSMMLCADVHACVARYRGGRTAAQYAAALRNGTEVTR